MTNQPPAGPELRADIIDAYVIRGTTPDTGHPAELLLLRRVGGSLHQTWHPVMGTIEEGETPVDTMWRELAEELSLTKGPSLVGIWALQNVFPFYLPHRNAIMLCPRFVVRVTDDWEPTLNDEHDEYRWIPLDEAPDAVLWPGQAACLHEIAELFKDRGPHQQDRAKMSRIA